MGKRYTSSRSIIAVILVIAMLCGFGYELYDIQVKNNEYFTAQSSMVKTYTVPIEAARGEIVDRNGVPLVTNRKGNSIILNAAYFPSSKDNDARNEIILNLLKLFKKNKEETVENLPLKLDKNGNPRFINESESKTAQRDIKAMKSADMFNLQEYATAQNCYDAMIEKYGLEKYDRHTAMKIGNIRYELTRLVFTVSNPVTIAEDVSDKTVAQIKENKALFLGADVRVVAYREYASSTLAPHIIGTVRKINAEEYKARRDLGYGINDEIGESGIEAACEEYLRGTPGEKTVTIDQNGDVTEVVTKEPIQGDTIVLTIDKDMQEIAQNRLKKICNSVSYMSTGAVVVEDVNSGEILAAANYPSYDLNDYYEHYSSLVKNNQKPLYNRFAMGAYAPGSTFKPLMSVAALEEGAINASTSFSCGKTFKVNDMTFKCAHEHGSLNVEGALEQSCNIFFYNCARILGIERMNQYGKMFGLGQKTGVEIPESSGIMAGPEYRKRFEMYWHPGDTVQAAIGQSDNLLTPLQLANYCATIANNGTRYKTHFVKSRISKATGAVTETGSVVEENTGISQKTFDIVKEGMRRVATDGGPWRTMVKLDTAVACKTGTSQVVVDGIKHNNGFLISFAPYENPEISVASAIELAGSGSSTAQITADVIDYYYNHNAREERAQNESVLL